MDTAVSKYDKLYKYIYIAAIAVYAGFLAFLFYNQLQPLHTGTSLYESDTAAHVSFAVYDGYYHSLAAFIYLFFIKVFGLVVGTVLITATLTAVTALAIPLTARLIREVLKRSGYTIPEWSVLVISFFANIHTAFYVSAVNKQHYIGYQCANMWHNSTYLFMRFFAILTVIAFIKLYEDYEEGPQPGEWLVFTLLLTVTTGFKASFLTVFAPVMAFLLIRDLLYGEKFKRVFSIGMTVVLPIGVMILQSIVMAGDGGSNGYAFRPFYALKMRGDHPKVSLILSVAFLIIVFFIHLLDFFRDKFYLWTLAMWAVGFLEVFLFVETGARALDSNFMWGYSISLFFAFLVSMVKLCRDIFDKRTGTVKRILCFAAAAVMLWHVISGVWYFALLLTGVTYFV